MAKRYTRINWRNKPNTATPLSAANLNKMDKGIKDCDDAIGDLALLNTNNKTDLVSAINEQNNNLAKYFEANSGTITSATSWDNLINNGIYMVTSIDGDGAPVGYNYGLLLNFCYSADKVLQIYFPHSPLHYPVYRAKFDGRWIEWKRFSQ